MNTIDKHTESADRLQARIFAFLSRHLGIHELGLLTIALLAVGGIWLFIELADEMVEGDTRAFDEKLVTAMRNPKDPSDPVGPKWLEEFGRDVTALGGVGFLTLLTLAVAGFLILQHKRRSAMFIVAAIAGGVLISNLLKSGFDRPRPDLVPHGSYVYTASFPSGHAALSAVTYLTLGALLAQVQSRRRVKAYLIILALLITIAVGASRVYLGVHWPTDVLAGWTLGISWALICWLTAKWLQRRGTVEGDARSDT
jgi:undecaprenyl-diphosphatase